MIGILALGLWGFLMGMLVCATLGLLIHGLLRGSVEANVRPVQGPDAGGSYTAAPVGEFVPFSAQEPRDRSGV